MKKYISLFAVLMLVFYASVSLVKAEDASSLRDQKQKSAEERKALMEMKENLRKEINEKKEKMRQDIQNLRAETKTKIDDLREKIKEERDAKRKKEKEERVNGREQALERFNVAIERMNILKDRVVDNIAKFEAKGVNVTEAKSFIAIIETKLTGVKAKITEANALLSASVDKLSKEDKIKLRTLAQDAQTLMKEAHQALNSAIKSLKEAVKLKREEVRNSEKKENTGNTNN